MRTTIDLLYLRPSELTKEQVAGIVGEIKMAELRERYEHPDLRCFVIAHEGYAEGRSGGQGVILEYLKKTIRELYRSISTGIPAFFRHRGDGTNNRDRDPIGEVVGKQLKEDENGDMYTLAVFLIYPEYKDLNLDVASVESTLVIDQGKYGYPEIVSVEDVTAVALSTSALEEPGFPNARLLAAFQYFKEQKDDKMELTLEQVKAWLKDNAARPSDIFNVVEICRDAEVTKEIDARLQTKHEHARRLEAKLAEVEKAKADTETGLTAQIKEFQKKLVDVTAQRTITQSLADVADEKVRGIVEKKLKDGLAGALDGIEDPEKVQEVIDGKKVAIMAEIEELRTVFTPPAPEKPATPVDRKQHQKPPAMDKPAGGDKVVNDNPLIPAHLSV